MTLPDVPLKPAGVPFKRCSERGCDAIVSEYRWSPYFCPPHDVERMERIDANMARIAASFEEKSP